MMYIFIDCKTLNCGVDDVDDGPKYVFFLLKNVNIQFKSDHLEKFNNTFNILKILNGNKKI